MAVEACQAHLCGKGSQCFPTSNVRYRPPHTSDYTSAAGISWLNDFIFRLSRSPILSRSRCSNGWPRTPEQGWRSVVKHQRIDGSSSGLIHCHAICGHLSSQWVVRPSTNSYTWSSSHLSGWSGMPLCPMCDATVDQHVPRSTLRQAWFPSRLWTGQRDSPIRGPSSMKIHHGGVKTVT